MDPVNADSIFVEKGQVYEQLKVQGTVWIFNLPHAPHMGGVWEKRVGLAKSIFDSMLPNHQAQKLSHDVLSTFMCEVSAIINSRSVAALSYDPKKPEVITPYMLLTQKMETVGDIVLLQDIEQHRNSWPMGMVVSVFLSQTGGTVGSVEVC